MQKYQNNVQNRQGDAMPTAAVRVVTYPGGALATIYSDNGITPAANPLTTDSNGSFAFYAADGRYSLQISGNGITPLTISDISLTEELPPAIVGGTIDGAVIGGTTPSAGHFTTLSTTGAATLASGSVGGTPLVGEATTQGLSNKTINTSSIGATTPSTGAFTTISATGTITPSQTAGIVGTTTNNNANAGSVGEYVSNQATGVSLTTNTSANITSISLTAGDWDVWANFLASPAGGASVTVTEAGISTTSATMPTGLNGGARIYKQITDANASLSPVGMSRISVAATTTVYLVGRLTFASGTATADGFIGARRVR